MRQVFASPRNENVDRVEALLNEAGIATRVVNRDKLQRDRFQRFSYREQTDAKTWPAVQIVLAEDLPKARELLRAAGLMGSTRPDTQEAIPRWEAPGNTADRAAATMRRVAMIGVLGALILLAFFYSRGMRTYPPSEPAIAPAATSAPPVEDNTVFLLDESESESESDTGKQP